MEVKGINTDQNWFLILLKVFEVDLSLGLLIKLSLLSRKIFLAFKYHAKEGRIKTICHRNHGDSVSLHLIRRICARRIGSNLSALDFQFSAVTDDHFELAKLPKTLESLNLNAC